MNFLPLWQLGYIWGLYGIWTPYKSTDDIVHAAALKTGPDFINHSTFGEAGDEFGIHYIWYESKSLHHTTYKSAVIDESTKKIVLYCMHKASLNIQL